MNEIEKIKQNEAGWGEGSVYKTAIFIKRKPNALLGESPFSFSLIDWLVQGEISPILHLMDLMYWFNKNCIDVKTRRPKWTDISCNFSETAC